MACGVHTYKHQPNQSTTTSMNRLNAMHQRQCGTTKWSVPHAVANACIDAKESIIVTKQAKCRTVYNFLIRVHSSLLCVIVDSLSLLSLDEKIIFHFWNFNSCFLIPKRSIFRSTKNTRKRYIEKSKSILEKCQKIILCVC